MSKDKYTFNEFIENVGESHIDFYREIHRYLRENGFKEKIELKKSGYAMSFVQVSNKKTLLNIVNRKKGMFFRLYSNYGDTYMDKIIELPDIMIDEIKKGQACKKMSDPKACNSKCQMGINLIIDGGEQAKCRYSALYFKIEAEKYRSIKKLLESEVIARNKFD